jgi:hypothetical protein
MNDKASGWKKRQVADEVAKDNVVNLGELLRAKLEAAAELDDKKKSYLPKNMTNQQILDLTPDQVYMHVRTGEWTIADFVAWVVACETYAFIQGAEDKGVL